MSSKFLSASLTTMLMSSPAFADVPSVAVDVAPVHSLVARVMQGVGEPALVIPAGASPHHYSLRPSEARALQDANLVFWLGQDLTPWLKEAIESLAHDASVTSLLETEGTTLLEFRESALFDVHDHENHEEHDHAEAKDHDGHNHDDHDDHDTHDPHAWLYPDNAALWLNVVAAQLSAADPDNAGKYYANAAAGRAELDTLKGEISATLDPVRGSRFIVFHDAYQYFEVAFNFPASGAIWLGAAENPSPARIADIQHRVQKEQINCVLSEPQYNPGMVATVMDGTNAVTGVLDPLGSDLQTGARLYPNLLKNLATTLAECLKH